MTLVLKQAEVGNTHINIEQNKFTSAYDVVAYHVYEDGSAIVINENTYPTIEKARKRFSYLKSLAKKGELV